MTKLKLTALYLFLFFFSYGIENLGKAEINPDLLKTHWSAYWINFPGDNGLEYGIYHFRKTILIDKIPEKFIIHVSADNRYRLFLNGKPVCFGPARGDLFHWKFESINVADLLQPGKNVFAAVVWNYADKKPWAQHSLKTAFILQGNSETEKIANSNSTWKAYKNKAFNPADQENLGTFIVVGPGDEINGNNYPWNWEQPDFDDSDWEAAKQIDNGRPKEAGTGIDWGLEPREIPLMEAKKQLFESIKRSENISVDNSFINGNKPITIPPNKTITLLFDQGELTTAYPEIILSGGKNAQIKLIYAEALFDENGNKGNRNEIENKQIRGNSDLFIADGGEKRMFRPLWLRTWRYLQLEVSTQNQPLTIEKFQSEFTAYPFQENATFTSNDRQLSEIWDVGWRTARLCAGETYYDCPYYEQLQYVGDTRIQALISLYISGDDRLMRKAIQLYDDSRFSEGLTMSRYPSSTPQVIPTYSLFWINMVYDYWMHRTDDEFVKSFLNGIDNVMDFFVENLDKTTGLVGYTGYWNFVDWAVEWPWNNETRIGGVPRGGHEGNSSIITFQLIYSAQHAAELHRWAGNPQKADFYQKLAKKLLASVKNTCWDESRNYFANTPEKIEFSMHAQILAVLTGAVEEEKMQDFVLRFEADSNLIQPTMYFRFYLTQALKKAGLADSYLETLNLWREMLEKGLSTFAEKPDPTRSDCHAWSASPNYDFLATVAGIEPMAPGFEKIKMSPALGSLTEISGKMPHPNGTIFFNLKRIGKNGIEGEIILPENLNGIFFWNGREVSLENKTTIKL